MKKTLLLVVSFVLLVQLTFAATTTKAKPKEITPTDIVVQPTLSNADLSNKQIEKLIGRRLSLKEKISLFLIKKRIVSPDFDPILEKKANSNAVMGFAFSLAGLLLFPLFAIPGLIFSNNALRYEKIDPGILKKGNSGLALAGKIISIVSFVLMIIVIILVIAFASSWP